VEGIGDGSGLADDLEVRLPVSDTRQPGTDDRVPVDDQQSDCTFDMRRRRNEPFGRLSAVIHAVPPERSAQVHAPRCGTANHAEPGASVQ